MRFTRLAVRAEITGLILVLLSAGWQLFLEDKTSALLADTHAYQQNEKLNLLWMYLGKLGRNALKDEPVRVIADYGDLDRHWQSLEREADAVAKQAEIFRNIRIILFLTGSLLLLIGRSHELEERLRQAGMQSVPCEEQA